MMLRPFLEVLPNGFCLGTAALVVVVFPD